MSKLKQLAFYALVLVSSCLVSRAVFAWHHLVSNVIDTLHGSLIVGLAGSIPLTILTNLANRRRGKN